MSEDLTRHSQMLRFLCSAKPPSVKAVLKTASPELIRTLCECSHNVLKGNVHLTPQQKRQLSQHKHSLRLLTKRKTSVKKKKQILQKGGFIGLLLKPVLSALSGLFS